MTKDKALFAFMSSFGIPAYVSTSVPDDAPFPRLTYDPVFDNFFGGQVVFTVNLWYRTESESEPNSKAFEITRKIGEARTIRCDEGGIIIRCGNPLIQNMSDPDDSMIKRRYINLTLEYITQD